MKIFLVTIAAATLVTGAAFAESQASGDPAAGKAEFKQCQSCHVVTDDEGNTLAGRKARTGPNLFGIPGRPAGSVDRFRYGKAMVAAGKAGLAWDEESFVAYAQDPITFLRDFLENPKARGKMTYKVRKEQDAKDLYAFLVSVSPEMDDD